MTQREARAWSVALFAARERIEDLERTLMAALAAAASEDSLIDVLVNGNSQLAGEAAALAGRLDGQFGARARLRVWFIALGDKAHAWNQYVHVIWPAARVAYFVDGYVRLRPDALGLIDQGLAASAHHLAATGVPTVGRTAATLRKAMLSGGGIHGNLYALKGSTMERLRATGFKLPLGLYRTDPTLGAALAFGLDPGRGHWDPKGRILVHPEATWDTDEKQLSRTELAGQFKRLMRQGQGILENLAVKHFLSEQRLPPERLPATAAALVAAWAGVKPGRYAAAVASHPLTASLGARSLRTPRDWSAANVAPTLRYPSGGRG